MDNIYIFDLNNKDFDESIINTLPTIIQERINKYNVKDDYIASLISWKILVDKLLSDYNIEISCLKENKYHKPYIDNIYFNISHSYKLVCVIISDIECGIDVELINNKLDHNLLAKKILNQSEYKEYKKIDNKQEYIIMKWTQKEAYFKKIGTGIIMSELSNIDTNEINTIKLQDSNNNIYYLSYTGSKNINIQYIDF